MKILFLLSTIIGLGISASSPALKTLQEQSKAEKKYIAVYFCGSDWCSVCHKYKRETLEVGAIDSTLKNQFVFYTADFPQRVKLAKEVVETNEILAEKLNPGGIFPLLVITDSDLNIKASFKRGVVSNDELLVKLNQLSEACRN